MSIAAVTVTLNPAIDRTIVLDALYPGQVHRARSVRSDAGGKGVNVASCLADWGMPVAATGLLGYANAAVFEELFAAKGIHDCFQRLHGDTRINIKLLHGGETTDINLPGNSVDALAQQQIVSEILELGTRGRWVILSGSVPAGLPADIYATLIAALTRAGAQVLLDTGGEPLAAALTAASMPYCIKPSRAELEAWIGHELPTTAALVDVAQILRRKGVSLVIVPLGAEGGLFVTGDAALQARLPEIVHASTVGAGDAMVAGIVAALVEGSAGGPGPSLDRIARLGTAFAAAKLKRIGAHLPPRTDVEALATQVRITPVDALPSSEVADADPFTR